MPSQYGEIRPTKELTTEIGLPVSSTRANFNGFRVLAPALLHGTVVVGGSQTLRVEQKDGVTYIRQGGHAR